MHSHANVAAADVSLTVAEQRELETATESLPVVGERYSEEGMKGVNV